MVSYTAVEPIRFSFPKYIEVISFSGSMHLDTAATQVSIEPLVASNASFGGQKCTSMSANSSKDAAFVCSIVFYINIFF